MEMNKPNTYHEDGKRAYFLDQYLRLELNGLSLGRCCNIISTALASYLLSKTGVDNNLKPGQFVSYCHGVSTIIDQATKISLRQLSSSNTSKKQ